ncbi:MAG TPA: HAD family hydrolase [Tepidisphaeraceae bacterium]
MADLIRSPRALLLDMDGTLTKPMLDFPLIKREMGIGDRAILEALTELNPTDRAAAEAVLLRHEEHAARESTLNAGCIELLAWAGEHHVKTALITRNSRMSVEVVCRTHDLKLDVVVSREDAKFKPDPEPLISACERLNVEPNQTWMIGDGRYDIEAGLAAGVPTVWISHGRSRTFDAIPCETVSDLHELRLMLQRTTRSGV